MKKWVKWTGRVVLGIFLLLVLLILAIHTGPVKRLIRNKLEAYLSGKIKTEFHIAAIDYRLPKWVELDGVLLRDKKGDTLLYGNKVRVDVNMFKLLSGHYQISRVELEHVIANVSRGSTDSTFNYQFIIDAFAGRSSATPAKKSTFSFSLDEVKIDSSAISYHDAYGGTLMSTVIGSFHLSMDSINLNTEKFAVSSCDIKDMSFDLHLSKPVRDVVANNKMVINTGMIVPSFWCKTLHIDRSHFNFKSDASGIDTRNDINHLSLQKLAAITPENITLDQLNMDNSSILLNRKVVADQKDKTTAVRKDSGSSNVKFSVKQLSLAGNTLVYDDESKKKQAKGFDAGHIHIQGLNADINNIDYTAQKIQAGVKSMSMYDQSGVVLDTLHGFFVVQDTLITADNMLLKTKASRIAGKAVLYPQTFDRYYKGNRQNTVHFLYNRIASKDVRLFLPALYDKYSKQLQDINMVYMSIDVKGNAAKALIQTFTAYTDKNDFFINANGTVMNGMDTKRLQYNLVITRLTARKTVLDQFINQNGKQHINLPPVINISGKLNGSLEVVNPDLVCTSDYGVAAVKGQLRNITKPDQLGYNIRLVAKDLETGKWIDQDSLLGKLNGTVSVKGSGIDYKTASINSSMDIASFRLQQHLYTGINFNIDGTGGTYKLKGNITDSSLRLRTNMQVGLSQQYPSVTGKLNVQRADLYALGFYPDTLTVQTMADIQMKDLSPDRLNAFLRLDSTVVYKDKRIFRTDSLIAEGKIDSGKTLLSLRSSMADATIKGDYKYDQLGNILQYYITRYSRNTTVKNTPPAGKTTIDLVVNIRPDPMYAVFLPGLFFDKNIHATGKIDTRRQDSSLTFYLTAPGIIYNSDAVANLNVKVNGIKDSIKYVINVDTIRASSLELYTTSVSGGFSNNHLSAALVTNDEAKRPKYAIGINGEIDGETYRVHLADKLKLNYADWKVDPKNTITYNKQGVNISQFTISKGNESIAVNSTSTAPNAPVDIRIDRFSLNNINGLLNSDSLQVAGFLNAQVKVDGLDQKIPLFSGNVKIDSLSYQRETVGNISLDANSDNTAAVTFKGALTGNGNNVTLSGNYNQDKIDATVNLSPIAFRSIEPFTQHSLTRSSGKLSGNIHITGDIKSPQWNGEISFDSTFTQLAKYGTVLKMSGQKIVLQYPTITLNRVTINDSLNHSFVIDGTVTEENGAYNANLTARTTDFIALHSTATDNNELYGNAIVDVDANISGPATALDITGNLALKEKSVVTYVRQQRVASAKDRDGVVEFVNMDTIKNRLFIPDSVVVLKRPRLENNLLKYNLNIDINKNAQFNVIIDPATRDQLQVQGSAQLNAAVNPNGDISLTGAYNLTQGSYQLNSQFLKRKFLLQEGSTIVLSGDPKNAEADITAIYEIEASPYDLVENEVSGSINNEDRLYRQKIPFQVLLKIKGKVLEPQLTFDIQVKDKADGVNYDMATTIENKLTQMRTDASTMNKQVFALLVMGRFIGEQSQDFFAGANSGSGSKADEVVKESVSRFLSDAVSQVAADLIKGVDVDVNLKTVDDYSTAAVTERTDLSLGLSKRFMNDRLSITVGKNFTVDGEDPLAKSQNNDNVQFLPDITTTYKLSKDGRYMIKAYQKSEYEAILDGYFIETGVVFSITMDYNKFKELFEKKKKQAKKVK